MAISTYRRKEIPGNILSMTQLGQMWGCCSGQIYKFIKDGLPYKKTGNEYEFNLVECEEWWQKGYFNSLPRWKQNKIITTFKGVRV